MSTPKFLGVIMNGGVIPAKDLVAVTPTLEAATRTEIAIRKLATELGHTIELDTDELLRQKLEEKRKKHDPNNRPSASNADNTMRMG